MHNNINPIWHDYLEMCKPKVVALMLITSIIGMLLANTNSTLTLELFIFANLGIALAAASAATLNHIIDKKYDQFMRRTKKRPLPCGRVSTFNASTFASVLALAAIIILLYFTNPVTTSLTVICLVGYALVYTIFLKHATPQNIVIGGASGAAPPLLGWSAVTGSLDPYAWLLVLIIYVWTPPHFWSLAIYKIEDYAKAQIPMLPVTHGVEFTKLCITLYTILLIAVSILPTVFGMSGYLYLISALILGGMFLYYALVLQYSDQAKAAINSFKFSSIYLLLLFIAMLVDHYL